MPKLKKMFTSAKFFTTLIEDATVETKKRQILECLEDGANINERFAIDSDNTPLHISVINGEIEIVNLLLQRGANVNYKNNEGKTPIDIAKELDSNIGSSIVELLERFEAELEIDNYIGQDETFDVSIVKHNNPQLFHHKRAGTSGIKGQLYHSKLLSLVFIRASLIKGFDEFYLGTRLDDIGAFDDVCVRYLQDGAEGVVFLRVNHTSDVNKGKLTVEDLWRKRGDFCLHKHFESFIDITQKLENSRDADALFSLKTHNIKCTFAIYTTAQIDLKDKLLVDVDSLDETARDLISSGEYTHIYRYKYNKEDIDLLANTALQRTMLCIAKHLVDCIYTGNCEDLFDNYCIRIFHVVLAQNVIKLSEITDGGYRLGTFRNEFFHNFDANVVALKFLLYRFCLEAVDTDQQTLCELIYTVSRNATVLPLSKLMQIIMICYNRHNNTLYTTEKRFRDVTYKLSHINVSCEVYNQALEVAVKEKLGSLSFKLPSKFGNVDIEIYDEENCEQILMYFAEKLLEMLTLSVDPNMNQHKKQTIANEHYLQLFHAILPSAIGNLLILNKEDYCYKFNTNDRSLGKNAKTVLKILKSRIENLDDINLLLLNPLFPKLKFDADEKRKLEARFFFENLCFYTHQSSESEIEELSKESIQDYCIANNHEYRKNASNAQYDGVYAIIHNAVQKWYMSNEKSYYLENNRDFIDRLLKEFRGQSLLNIMSSMFINRMRKYQITFNKDAVERLSSQVGPEATVIITEVNILTGIKMTQCYNNLNNYAFVDLNHITRLLSKNDYHTLIRELQCTRLKALIILYEDVTEAKNRLFLRLTQKSVTNTYILVTNQLSAEKLKLYITNETFVTLHDARNDLSDLTCVSQEKILDKTFLFQGESLKFTTILTPESKSIIKGKILQNIVNDEMIDIGKVLTDPYYEKIKPYYIQRHLSRDILSQQETIKTNTTTPFIHNEEIIKINTLEALKDTVVIVGAPGMGKSTFLTYLSIETKRNNPGVWIERVNLLDQTKELHRLQENNVKINKINAIKFVCKAALSRNLIRFSIKPTLAVNFDLEIDKLVVLKGCDEIDYLVLFELEMLIHCYNQGKLILLFDGFDEVCPHYKNVMTEILKCLVTRCSSLSGSDAKQRMWITSRSYSKIRVTLETEFGVAYNLKMFTRDEQNQFMTSYLINNITVSELNIDQFKNIDSFFDFMSEFASHSKENGKFKLYKSSTAFLQLLYFNAMNYFIQNINKPLTSDKKAFQKKWVHIFESHKTYSERYNVGSGLYLYRQYRGNVNLLEKDTLTCTPLHNYLVMEYFINQIKTVDTNRDSDVAKKWDFEMSISLFYNYSIEMKLKKIRFQEKNQMDLYNPDIASMYERELKEFLNKHKKLAFYATFTDNLNQILTGKDINEIRNVIREMEAGREKTGLVDSILSSGIPKFVHLSFQDYLAAEYFVDLLKSHQKDQSKLWRFVISQVKEGFLEFLDRKMEFDDELMNSIIDIETKQMIFNDSIHNNFSICTNLHNPTVLERAIDLGFKQITKLLLTAMADVLCDDNLLQFILMTIKVFQLIAVFGWDDVLCVILDCVRKVNPGGLYLFNPNYLNRDLYILKSNLDIIRDFKWQWKRYVELCRATKKSHKPRLRFNTI